MQRTQKKILKPKKHEKVLPLQDLLPDIAKKVITHKLSCHETSTPNLAETHKISMSSRMDIIIKIRLICPNLKLNVSQLNSNVKS